VQSILDWLVTLPPAVLYPLLAGFAAIENFVPPFPADVAVAFGAFVAASGGRPIAYVFLSAWLGNVIGATAVYELGKRYGASRLEHMISGKQAKVREARFRAMFQRFGIAALFVARFVPGVRALVPVVAGALKLPPLPTIAMLTSAAAIWYGIITLVAFRVDASWPEIQGGLTQYTAAVGVVAAALLALGIITWILFRRRRRRLL